MTVSRGADFMVGLANRLLEQTRAGKVPWGQTDRNEEYIFSSTSSSVVTSSIIDNDGDRHSKLSLLNSAGIEAGVLEGSFTENGHGGWNPGPFNTLLDDLFISAREHVLDVNNALNDMYEALGGPGGADIGSQS